MDHYRHNVITPERQELTFCSIAVAGVFFVVLSQFLIVSGSSITFAFRPAIILAAILLNHRMGVYNSRLRMLVLFAAIYEALVLGFQLISGDFSTGVIVPNNPNEPAVSVLSAVTQIGSSTVLYLLMLFSVIGIPWSKKELQVFVASAFLAAVVCAIVFARSNDLTDFDSGEYHMLGTVVNRNKNAYAFSLGTLIGIIYLIRGKRIPKTIILLCTLLMGYCVLYSQCRGAFIGLVGSCVVLAYGSLSRMRKSNERQYFACLFLMIAGLIAAYFIIKNSSFSRLVADDSTSGRENGIENAFEMFLGSDIMGKLFGNGFLYEKIHSDDVGAHLVYATFLVSSGLVGAGLIAMIFISSARLVKGSVAFSLFAQAFIRTFFEGLDYYIYIPLILAICLSQYQRMYGRSYLEVFYGKTK